MALARFAVDFDGTLVEDDTYPEMGDWLPGAADAVRKLERLGRVVIYSCRVAEFEQDEETPRNNAEQVALIKAKLAEEGLDHLEIWTKPYKPPAAAYIDNRGIAFRGDWAQTLDDVLDLIAPLGLQKLFERESVFKPEAKTCPVYVDCRCAGQAHARGLMGPKMGEETRHPSSQRFVDRVDGWIALHDQKQKDYGSDTDPFANVRNGARKMGLPGWVGAVIRMNDKMERLNKAAKQFIETGSVNLANEGVIDSFDDMGVYSGIGATLFEEESRD